MQQVNLLSAMPSNGVGIISHDAEIRGYCESIKQARLLLVVRVLLGIFGFSSVILGMTPVFHLTIMVHRGESST
jgi:hypothetical protein